MKLIHLSDLHLGIRFCEFSMYEEQKHILCRIVDIVDNEKPQAVIIAGDVYDKAVPSAEAVQLFDEFLFSLSQMNTQVFVVSGNHDSPERIAFGSRLMGMSGVHLSPVYNGEVNPEILTDEFGEVAVYMLPFIKPIHVRTVFADDSIESYTEAVRCAIDHMDIDLSRRNVMISHQFVTGAERCDSETVSVGGSDNVDASVFEKFDYTALGHIHGPQNVSGNVRYCGTPLKYSFSEKAHEKSVTVVELGEKGNVQVRTVPLTPLRDVREIRGSYDELTAKSSYEGTAVDDFLRVVLTDDIPIPNALNRLRLIYSHICELRYDNNTSNTQSLSGGAKDVELKSPTELLAEFYFIQNGSDMTDEQKNLAACLFEKIGEEM